MELSKKIVRCLRKLLKATSVCLIQKKKKNWKKKKNVDREDPKANRSLFELKNKLKDGFE